MIVKIPGKNSERAKYLINSTELYQDSVLLYDPVCKEFWLVQHESELEGSFFFVGDLIISTVSTQDNALYTYLYYQKDINPHYNYTPVKYLLVCDELKVFDAYSVKGYPMQKYGKEIPRGMVKTKYVDRESRDLIIEELLNNNYVCIFDKDIHDYLTGNADD